VISPTQFYFWLEVDVIVRIGVSEMGMDGLIMAERISCAVHCIDAAKQQEADKFISFKSSRMKERYEFFFGQQPPSLHPWVAASSLPLV
jgi:hypothetical protein